MPRSIATWVAGFFALGLLACWTPGEDALPKPAQATAGGVLAVDEATTGPVEHRRVTIIPQLGWEQRVDDVGESPTVVRTPMSLTAGDGSGLRLVSVTGHVVIEDPLAFTELHLTFENPEARRREGRFEMELPAEAALSRLAMKIGSRWMEGEIVERAKAQQTFEEYIHWRPRVDPALMEKAAANRVSARVFPIQPHERKEIIVSYSQPLAGGSADGPHGLRLPLRGLPRLDTLDVDVIVKTSEGNAASSGPIQKALEVHERGFAPSRDLLVKLDGAGPAGALRSNDLIAVRVRPQALSAGQPVDVLTVLFDTSASSSIGFGREVDRLGSMLQALGDAPVRIVAFDQTVSLVHDGPASAATPALARLGERKAFGASNLAAALAHPLIVSSPHRRLLIWSDGVATAGETSGGALADAAAAAKMDRIDTYASQTTSDRATLSTLAAAGARAGFVFGPDLGGADLVSVLTRSGFDSTEVAIEGAQWSYPRSLEGFAPGDDVVVFARFAGKAPDVLHVGFSDPRLPDQRVPTMDGAAPLLERAAARARVRELDGQLQDVEDERADALRGELLRLALEHRLLTRHTALLVLENESEYRRYGIGRTARADILTAGPTGVERLRRGTATGSNGGSPDLAVRGATRPVTSVGAVYREDLEAREAGILGVVKQQRGHFLASPHGAAFAVGDDQHDVWGGVTGEEMGEAYGVGGLGLVGTGRGGGGKGEGTIGLGNTGLIGKGGGGGTGVGYGATAGSNSGLYAMKAGTGGSYGRSSGGLASRRPTPRVRQAQASVRGALDKDIIRRVVRAHINEVRHCYDRGLQRNPNLAGRVEIAFTITGTGRVGPATVNQTSVADAGVGQCVAKAAQRWKFPTPRGGGLVEVRYPFLFSTGSGSSGGSNGVVGAAGRRGLHRPGDPSDPDGARWRGSAQSGRFGSLLQRVTSGDPKAALAEAWAWAAAEPDNALALAGLGEMLELDGQRDLAARVYGSIIDLHPNRPDMRRTAGGRLDALGETGRTLAIDTLRKAVDQRPDQINGRRLLAWTLAKDQQFAAAFEAMNEALSARVPAGRFRGAKSLIRQDRELLAAAWLAATGNDAQVQARLRESGVRAATTASLRVVASWETDATDVDILVDPIGPGDGRRHADVRNGWGPEAWISRSGRTPAAVHARVRYFNRGVMGYAMGTATAIAHDGAGTLTFRARPFVLMNARGSVDLGRFDASGD